MAQPVPSARPSRSATLFAIALVVAALYFGQDVLIPMALATLLSFLLAPAVLLVQRLGVVRIPAVLIVVLLSFALIGLLGWVVAGQAIDLAEMLPQYKENIREKIQSVRRSIDGEEDSVFDRAGETLRELGKELSQESEKNEGEATEETEEGDAEGEGALDPAESSSTIFPDDSVTRRVEAAEEQVEAEGEEEDAEDAVAVRIVTPPATTPAIVRRFLGPLVNPLATAGIVIVLVIFMLISREDLRDRVLRLVGTSQINVTTQALDDAGRRVSRYLLMQLVCNGIVGTTMALGLFLIGVPNALLWGLLSTVLRFIPYLGAWTADVLPIAVSIAVFDGWTQPLLTIGFIVVLELISNNFLEPVLYGAGSGVSALGIIAAAIFWTWMWGGVGLLLATPLTVCLVVLGRHVPQLSFFNVLLGDDPGLPPEARFYQRLLAMDQDEAAELVEEHLQQGTVQSLYDEVMLPALNLAEHDRHRDALSDERLSFVHQSVREFIEEMEERPEKEETSADQKQAKPNGELKQTQSNGNGNTQGSGIDNTRAKLPPGVRVLCVPARDEADELVGEMLAQLLRKHGATVTVADADALSGERISEGEDADVVCVSALPPFAATHARYLCKRIRKRFGEVKLLVGLWHYRGDRSRLRARFGAIGADRIATTLEKAIEQIAEIAPKIDAPMQKPPMPQDEPERLEELKELGLLDTPPEEVFDRFTRRLSRIFDAPISLMTLLDENRQWWKSQVGLPPGLAEAGCTPRDVSICGHVVGINETVVVEDAARDPRFANNPLLVEHKIRFYAGAPLRTESGRVIGSLCILDTKPRRMTPSERQLLEIVAEDLMREVKLRDASRHLAHLTRDANDRNRDVERELEQARAVQHCLLPPAEHHGDAYHLCYLYQPVTTLGGDFVDVRQRGDGTVVLFLADAVGHGTSAALSAAMLKTAFLHSASEIESPQELLTKIAEDLSRITQPGRFVTAIAAVMNAEACEIRISSAGHPFPILLRQSGSEVLKIDNDLPLLVEAHHRYESENTVQLQKGDRLLFYTDGAVEAMSESGKLLGSSGLARLAAAAHNRDGKAHLDEIFEEIRSYADGELTDDIALLSLHCL